MSERACQYIEQLEAHMDAGGMTGPNNVRDLIQMVRETTLRCQRLAQTIYIHCTEPEMRKSLPRENADYVLSRKGAPADLHRPPSAPGSESVAGEGELKTWKNGRLEACTIQEFTQGLRRFAGWADEKFSIRSDTAAQLGERLATAADLIDRLARFPIPGSPVAGDGREQNPTITQDEMALLEWLGKEDFSQYGECHGKTLDVLIEKGLAQLHGDSGNLGSFIAKGDGPMYQSVSLTDLGRSILRPPPSKEGGER